MMIDIRSPTSTFINVDLPTFGLPIMFTNPDLCILCVMLVYVVGMEAVSKKASKTQI